MRNLFYAIFIASLTIPAFAQNIKFKALRGNQIKVIIDGVKGGTHTVNFYVASANTKGKFKFDAKTRSGSLSKTVYSVPNDKQVVVKILNYRGNGKHVEGRSKLYRNYKISNPKPTYPKPTHPKPIKTSPVTVDSKRVSFCGGNARVKLTSQYVNGREIVRLVFSNAYECKRLYFHGNSKSYKIINGAASFEPPARIKNDTKTCGGLGFTLTHSYGQTQEWTWNNPSACHTTPTYPDYDSEGDY